MSYLGYHGEAVLAALIKGISYVHSLYWKFPLHFLKYYFNQRVIVIVIRISNRKSNFVITFFRFHFAKKIHQNHSFILLNVPNMSHNILSR